MQNLHILSLFESSSWKKNPTCDKKLMQSRSCDALITIWKGNLWLQPKQKAMLKSSLSVTHTEDTEQSLHDSNLLK